MEVPGGVGRRRKLRDDLVLRSGDYSPSINPDRCSRQYLKEMEGRALLGSPK